MVVDSLKLMSMVGLSALWACGAEGKSLKDEDILQHLPVGTTATFYFRDLGAQISWVTVSV